MGATYDPSDPSMRREGMPGPAAIPVPGQAQATGGPALPPQAAQPPGMMGALIGGVRRGVSAMQGQPYGGIDPTTVHAMLQMQQNAPQQAAIDRQRKIADQLRADAAGQMKGIQAGQVYRAPGVMNAVAQLASNWKANQLQNDANLREQNMGVQNTDAMRRYFQALTSRGGRSPGIASVYSGGGDEGE